jgi:glutamate-1-semialdehyde 2,1-aminomutase
VYQAGTLSGNPVAMAAGLAQLELISAPGFHAALARTTNALCDGLESAARDAGVPFTTNRTCGMFGLFFTDVRVRSFADAKRGDAAAFKVFFHAMLEAGVFLAPSAFEAGFTSSSHEDGVIAETLAAARGAFQRVAKR